MDQRAVHSMSINDDYDFGTWVYRGFMIPKSQTVTRVGEKVKHKVI